MNPYRDVVVSEEPVVAPKARVWPVVLGIGLIMAVCVGWSIAMPVLAPMWLLCGFAFAQFIVRSRSAKVEAERRAQVEAFAECAFRNIRGPAAAREDA